MMCFLFSISCLLFFLFWPGANSALTGHFIKAECRSVRAKHCSLCIG